MTSNILSKPLTADASQTSLLRDSSLTRAKPKMRESLRSRPPTRCIGDDEHGRAHVLGGFSSDSMAEIDNPRARLGEADVLAAFNRRRASEGNRAEVVEWQDPPRLLLGASTIHSADDFDELY